MDHLRTVEAATAADILHPEAIRRTGWASGAKTELDERFDSPPAAKAKLCDYVEVFYNR